jgi:hypothetical protein
MLRRIRQKDQVEAQAVNNEFSAFLKSSAPANLTQEQREQLLRDFLQWRKKQGSTPRDSMWR